MKSRRTSIHTHTHTHTHTQRIFDTTRVPGKEFDIVMHYENDPNRYAAVSRKGVWYKVPKS
jgi:ribosomal protein L2